jgi:hypothetical protein
MKGEAHGTQQPRHINLIGEGVSTAQRSSSLVQSINQLFLDQGRARSGYCTEHKSSQERFLVLVFSGTRRSTFLNIQTARPGGG